MSSGLDWKDGDHEICIVDEAAKLMDRGFICYLEHWIQKYPHEKGPCRNFRYVVDIYATKGQEEILIEVGTLTHLGKLSELKRLKPQAKIIHVHQWKNYGITKGRMEILGQYRRLDLYKIAHPNWQQEAMHRVALVLEKEWVTL